VYSTDIQSRHAFLRQRWMMQALSAGGDFKPLKHLIETGGCTSGCLRLPGRERKTQGFIVS
jgi:hypothetical protein